MTNGTSSVLYGSVPHLVPPAKIEKAFAMFYTGTLGSSALAPIAFGRLGDVVGLTWATTATTATAGPALTVVPLIVLLSPHLKPVAASAGLR